MSALVIAIHATAASLSLTLGGFQLLRRTTGDRTHRLVGRVWVVAMYVMLVSSAFIRQLSPGHFSVFHALAIFTFGTLTIGLVAAVRGDIPRHRGYLRGSYVGVVGAFVGAVAVPQRDIPQLMVHRPVVFAGAVIGLVVLTAGIVRVCRRSAGEPAPETSFVEPRRTPSRVHPPVVYSQLV
jgi:uncharacterized membrane protein